MNKLTLAPEDAAELNALSNLTKYWSDKVYAAKKESQMAEKMLKYMSDTSIPFVQSIISKNGGDPNKRYQFDGNNLIEVPKDEIIQTP